MVRTLEELLSDVKLLGDEVLNSDAGITLVENITDSFTGTGITEENVNEKVNAAVAEVEAAWRKKYTDRFFNKEEIETENTDVIEQDDNVIIDDDDNVEKIEDLFE